MPRSSIDDLNKGLGFGLNARGTGASGDRGGKKKRKKMKTASVFDGGSSSSDGGEDSDLASAGGRGGVNRDIAAEQAALRRRAEQAMAAAEATGAAAVYDYDGEFESFSRAEEARKEEAAAVAADTKSRYIGKLLEKAQARKREHDILHERKVAREQAAEVEADEELAGKERFVTKSYKRKLAEREVWLKEELRRDEEEATADRARREGRGGEGMASFLGSVVRGDSGDKARPDADGDGARARDATAGDHDAERSRWNAPPKLASARSAAAAASASGVADGANEDEKVTRRKRNAKLAAARERYLERRRTGKVLSAQ